MRKFAIALTVAAVALVMPFAAHAQTFSGDANGASGSAGLEQSLFVSCDVTFNGTVTSGTSVAISSPSISPGDMMCMFVFPQGTWSAAAVPGDATKIDVTLGVDLVANDPCYGTVRADWDNVNKFLTITNKTLPPINPNGDTCIVHGALIYIPNLNLS